jgi:hypothetical protein
VTDLRTIVDSLTRDLDAWRAGTAAPPLDKHASQVESVAGQLSAALDELRPALDDTTRATQAVLDYHHIWDFFRGKLSLRYIPWYQPFLGAADDLAWAAWRPVRDAVRARTGAELREPPLVYFSRSAVPFAVPRGEDYRDLLPRGGIWTAEADEVASALVVPVISLPWHRTNWLPVTLSIAHEVGHVVVTDLGLRPWLTGRLAAADLPDARREAWTAWWEEVWADVFAAVVCGSATALSLRAQLGEDDDAEEPPWGDYPPASLRLRLIGEVARRRGGSAAAEAGEVGAVVATLLDHEVPGAGRLEDLFPSVDGTATRDDADRLARGRDLRSSDIRRVLAAATIAYATAPDGDRPAMQRAALARAAEIRDVGRRGRPGIVTDRDRIAGRRLAVLLAPGRHRP